MTRQPRGYPEVGAGGRLTRMLPWYRREAVRIAAVALASGLVLGGLIALAVSGPQLSPFGKARPSAAQAIGSDQAAKHKPAAKARPKPQPKSSKAAKASPKSAAADIAAATPSPDAADRSDHAKAKRERGDRAPRRAAAAPVRAAPRRT